MANYTMYLNEGISVCPKCSGMVTHLAYPLGFRCIDCGTSYRAISNNTMSERELICEEITIQN